MAAPTEPSRPTTRAVLPIRWGLVVGLSALYLVVALVQALHIRVVSLEAFEADGPSMEPTLLDGDRFVVDKSAYGLTLPFAAAQTTHWSDPAPGDVVVLRSPADDVDIVKRVIGVAGDRIAIRDGVVYRNGEPLARGASVPCGHDDEMDLEIRCTEEVIGDRRWTTSASRDAFAPERLAEIVVEEGTVFVLGDHRDRSNDSRNPRVGLIPVERVRGHAFLVYWGERGGRAGTWIE